MFSFMGSMSPALGMLGTVIGPSYARRLNEPEAIARPGPRAHATLRECPRQPGVAIAGRLRRLTEEELLQGDHHGGHPYSTGETRAIEHKLKPLAPDSGRSRFDRPPHGAAEQRGELTCLEPKSQQPVRRARRSWLLTYADMVTLLMAFFAMLFALGLDVQNSKPLSRLCRVPWACWTAANA